MEDGGEPFDATGEEPALKASRNPLSAEQFAGAWVSEVRQTRQGPMRFVFRAGDDGWLEIVGTPADREATEGYYRRGPYRLEGDCLVSPVINQGQPARLALQDGRLKLTIDETLTLQLRQRGTDRGRKS